MAQIGDVNKVRLLLARGAKPNAGGAAWSTPLAWARSQHHVEIERVLIAAGAS